MVTRLALVAAVAACGGKPHEEHPTPRGDATGPSDASSDATRAKTGDVQVRVELPDVAVAARASPGRTPCNTPRSPAIAPTTTWGIPDALVIVEGATPHVGGSDAVARLTLADCTVSPHLVVGTSLAITSAADRPAKLVLRKRGTLDHLEAGDPITIQLPVAGHTVTAALDAGAVYSLETTDKDPEVAWIATAPNAAVTDANGVVQVHDLAPGAHAVTAWYPPRGAQPALRGTASATASGGELTELTVKLRQ